MATPFKLAQLLRGLINGEMAHTGPFYANVDLDLDCNISCIGCPYRSSKQIGANAGDHALRYISLDLVKRLAAEFQELGVPEVILVGQGEPLLHPEFAEIISIFKHSGLKVQLYTNGTLLNEAGAGSILDSGLDILVISLWANNLEEYEKCYPGVNPKNFKKTIEGVKVLSELKKERGLKLPAFILTQPINHYNYKGIDARIYLAHSLGCDGVRFACFYSKRGEFSEAVLSNDEINIVLKGLVESRSRVKKISLTHNLDNVLLRYRMGERVWRRLPCYVGWFSTSIKVDGTVAPCCRCSMPLGNLYVSSFREIWNGPPYRCFRREGLGVKDPASLTQRCECDWCPTAGDNFRVHQIFKWFTPFLGSTSK
jgi:MoaA/NifB/PqqE/SkfB family radical SAM enzyme